MATFTIVSITAADNKSVTVLCKDGIGSEYYHHIDLDRVENWYYVDKDGYSKKHELRAGVKYEIVSNVKNILRVKIID